MLRLVIGYIGDTREGAPAVLYCGHDGDAAQTAIDNAPACMGRIETAQVVHLFRARRSRLEPAPGPGPFTPPVTDIADIEALAQLGAMWESLPPPEKLPPEPEPEQEPPEQEPPEQEPPVPEPAPAPEPEPKTIRRYTIQK